MLVTIQDITALAADAPCERDLNEELLDMLIDGRMSRDTYLEYLEITQGDIFDCLVEADPDIAFRG